MPRYLGINYWQKVIDQRRDFYSRALLTVPHHLALTNTQNTHNKEDQETQVLDQSIWKTCLETGQFADIDSSSKENLVLLSQLVADTGYLCANWIKNPEKYDWNTEFHTINNEVVEVVPSSNPESTYSFVSDELFESCDLFDDTCEIFEKEDLKKYGTDNEKDMLEDIVTTDGLKEIRDHIPQLSILLSRLKPKSVKDPLADEAGITYREDMCFKDHLKINLEDDSSKIVADTNLNIYETFEKCSEHSCKDGELEEILSQPRKQDAGDHVCMMLDIKTDIRTILCDEPKEPLDNNNDGADVVSGIYDGVEKLDSATPMQIEHADFIAVNNHEPERDKFGTEALFESPLISPKPVYMTKNPCQTLHDMLQDLQSVSSEHLNTTKTFLRQFEKETIQRGIWQHEKYFDEIIALRLPEPDTTDNTPCSSATVGELMKQLELEEESGLGTVELQLGWDPCGAYKTLMSQAANVEQISSDGLKLETVTLEAETFDKFTQDQLVNGVHSVSQDVILDEERQIYRTGETLSKKSPNVMDYQTEKSKHPHSLEYKDEIKNDSTVWKNSRKLKPTLATTADDSFVDFTPLDEFMMLRTSEDKKQHFGKVNVTKHSKIVIKEPVEEETAIKELEVMACNSILDVEFSGQFDQVLAALFAFGSPYVDVLKQAGEITKHASFPALKLDSVRFLVKQKEKQMQDKSQTECVNDLYKSLLVVYAVVGAADLLVHCCLESAISHLRAVHEKYQTTLGGSLDEIRKELFQYKVRFDQSNILHPKVATVCRNVEDVVKVTTENSDKKVLIVVKRNLPSLLSCLEKALSLTGDISTFIVKSLDDDTQSQMEKHNCIIIHETVINENFKLSSFDLLVEFESGISFLSKRCGEENIDFLSLRSGYADENMQKTEQIFSKESKTPDTKVTVIGSHHLTRQKNLLQLLESRHNIAVIERNYEDMFPKCPYADIILDERHCIVLHSVSDISEEWQVEHLSRKLAALGLQFTQCWLIFYSASKSTSYLLPNSIVANMSKLEAAIANLNCNSERFQIFYKVLLAYNLEQLAEVIRSCCDSCVETSTVWSRDEWGRDWVTGDASQDEQFLMSLPCLNSFSAQLLLSRACLGSLLSFTLPQLIKTASQLPEKILLTFYKVVNCDTGLHLRSQDPSETELYHPQSLDHNSAQVSYKPDLIQKNDYNSNELDTRFTAKRHTGMFNMDEHDITSESTHHQPDFREDNCLPSVPKYETKVSFSQETNDSSLGDSQEYPSGKPNQYILAKIDRMAENEGQLTEESICPDFDLVEGSDLHLTNIGKDGTFTRVEKFDLNNSYEYSDFSLSQSQTPLLLESDNHQNSLPNTYIGELPGHGNDRSKVKRKPSFSATLHKKLEAQNKLMEEFRTRDSFQPANLAENLPRNHNMASEKMSKNQNDSRYFPGMGCLVPDEAENLHRNNATPMFPSTQHLYSYRDKSENYMPGHIPNHSEISSWSSLPRPVSRKPVLSEQFQSRLLMPPIQRVSIGLAQPLRRNVPQNQQTLKVSGSNNSVSYTDSRWLTEGSPPMDLEPDSPHQDQLCYQTLKENRNYSYSNKVEDGYNTIRSCGMFPEASIQGDQFNDHFTYEDFPSKRKKLTYKPLPGRRAGQTVLAFR